MKILLTVLLTFSISVCCAQVDSLLHIGRSYAVKRDFENAELYFNKALAFSDTEFDNGRVLNNIGLLHTLQKSYAKAIQNYNAALDNFMAIQDAEIASKVLVNMGGAYRRMKEYSKAIDCYKEAFQRSKSKATRTSALNNIGRLTFSTGDYQNGITYFRKLAKEDHGQYQVHQNLARLYQKTNSIDSALISYKKALQVNKSIYSPISIELNSEIADMFYAAGKLNNAIEYYSSAIHSYEKLRNLYLIDQTKLKSSVTHKNIYLSAIECAAKLSDKSQTNYFLEHLKAPVLSAKIRENSLPDSAKLQLKKFDHEISLALKNESHELDLIINEKEKLLQQFPIPEQKDYKEVLQTLSKNVAVVNYSYSDSLLTTSVLFQGNTNITQQKINKQFFANIDTLATNTNIHGNSTYQHYTRYLKALHFLYDIFEPQYPKEASRILIIPYAKLYQIPFEALSNSKGSNEWADFTHIDYLVNRYAISYCPSINAMQYTQHDKVEKAIAFIPNYTADSLQLPYSLSEAKALQKHFSTDILKGEKASAENFFNTIGNYDIISVIAHGKSEEIILENDTIKADDLYKLNLNNCLTVLSTCQSNTGELQANEGYLGTARKFIEAGSESVLATLWDIPDESTMEIISDFYKHLSNGEPKDIALQKAKVNYLKSNWSVHRSPAFWSGLILIGNNSKVEKSGFNLYVVFGLVVFFFLFAFAVKYFRGSR